MEDEKRMEEKIKGRYRRGCERGLIRGKKRNFEGEDRIKIKGENKVRAEFRTEE